MSSLYLHIPFCEHKCLYCDFYSIAPDGTRADFRSMQERFLDALHREISIAANARVVSEEVQTIFFGGGTPSLLQPSDVEQMMSRLRSTFRIAVDAEVTLETNPGTVDRHRLEGFRSAGINRLSVGIQSFFEDDLRFLTRIHSATEARRCIQDARDAGFENISLDLIFSLPGQTMERWEENLRQALALNPTHLSCYSLIVEPNTPLWRMVERKEVTPLSSETDAALYELTMSYLAERGFEQYEVSNFCLPGFESKHNCAYWDHTNYLGFGPSAHSFWNDRRWWNISQLQGYLKSLSEGALPLAGEEILTERELMTEHIFLGLRSRGIDFSWWRRKFGRDFRSDHDNEIKDLLGRGLATLSAERLVLTPAGRLLCDEIAKSFE